MPKLRSDDSSKPWLGARPALPPSVVLGSWRRGALPPPLDAGRVTLYVKARNGIWQLIRALGVQEPEVVLVPSYNCGAELDAVLKVPATARFYRVDGSARVDFDDLRQAIDARTRAVLVTHYFGLPQPDLAAIVELCREHDLFLIEDCAHALYSTHVGRSLGTFGDAGIFSLWKTLPLPNGGAVLANRPLPLEGGTVRPSLGASLTPLRTAPRSAPALPLRARRLGGEQDLRSGRAPRSRLPEAGVLPRCAIAGHARADPESPRHLRSIDGGLVDEPSGCSHCRPKPPRPDRAAPAAKLRVSRRGAH